MWRDVTGNTRSGMGMLIAIVRVGAVSAAHQQTNHSMTPFASPPPGWLPVRKHCPCDALAVAICRERSVFRARP